MAIVTAHVNAVQQLYVAYFNRPADAAGLDYWTNVVAAQKGSTAAVSAAFAAEAEYKTAYANMTNAQVVNQVYQNLFGRAAETAGQNYWADLLDRKVITIDKVVADIAKGAQGTDAEAYENKVAGATAFSAALDTKAEQDGYRGAEANKLAKAFITSITTDASLTAAIAPAALSATVVKVVAAGTPFTLTSGLAAVEAAKEAKFEFLDTADGKDDGKVAAGTEAGITTKLNTAVTEVETKGGVAGYAAATSANVRAALVADKVAANATALNTATTAVATANTEIGKVAGLAAAVATQTSAKAAVEAATKNVTLANADLQAKEASYNALNGAAVDVAADGTVTGLIVLNADKKLVLATNITETTNPGVTALLNSSIAKEAADLALTNANKVKTAADANVNYLDMTATEVSNLETIKGLMKDVKVADGSLPTMAQIATQQAILKANADLETTPGAATAALNAFNAALATYEGNATVNTRVANLETATAQVKTANDAITALTKATDALAKATAAAEELKALDASIKAAEDAFVANGLTKPLDAEGSLLASAASDIYVASDVDASINLFGLLGKDSLFIGNDFTLNTGKLTAGNDAVLEAFIIADGSNTKVVLETSKFGSNAATPEIITITLTGVASTDVVLNNGIITVNTATV